MKENYSYPSVFHLLRSYLTDIDKDDIDLAENYILALGIRGSRAYEEPFTKVYKGISEEMLNAAERVRTALADILSPMSSLLAGKEKKTVAEMTDAVRKICAKLQAKEKLEAYVEHFEEVSDPERAIEYSQIYDILYGQFENMDSLIGDQEVSIKEFSELYEDALSEIRVGVIPPKSDVVMAGDLTRSRFSHIKALFFIGMTEGTIPASGSRGGLISDSDRQILGSIGTEVAPTAAENAEREKFYFYMNLMKPGEEVCFSYPKQDLDGTACRESYFMKEARRCLNISDAKGPEVSDEIYTKGELTALLAASIGRDDVKAALYLKALDEVGVKTDLADSMKKEQKVLSPEAAQILFGSRFIESPTELERFAACPYEHFLGYGLRLNERRSFDLELRDVGTLLHKILELFSRRLAQNRLTFRSVDDDAAGRILESAMKDAAEEGLSGRISLIAGASARDAHMIQRLQSYARRSVDTLRFQAKQGSFDGIYFERRFDNAGLKGTIDRCDEAVTESGVYIDVIDYKTGNKSFDPDRIYHGLDIQLPVYMDAAIRMRKEAGAESVRPAGLFYYHVDDPIVEGSRISTDEELDRAVRKELKLRGVVNSDMNAIRAFDRTVEETRKSIVVPVSFKANGDPDSHAMLYTEEQMRGMMEHTINLAGELRERIRGGEVAKSPYELDKKTGCDYCAYKEICDGGTKRHLVKMDFPGTWTV
jgi:ATP-dependent helicase/nuclease subunit B